MPKIKLIHKYSKKKSNNNANGLQESVQSKNKKLIKITRKKTSSEMNTPTISLSINNTDNILDKYSKFLPIVNINRVHPKYWELPNRKHFYNWINDTFHQYEETNKTKHKKPEIPRISDQKELNNIQRLTRDYLQGESPVRGLLLFIGLGVGKTCAAIAISEAILTKKEVIILSKANLENNFRKEIKECGADYLRTANHWVFTKCDTESEKALAKHLAIPSIAIRENDGMFLIDFTINTSNYNELSNIKKEKLDNQLNHMLNNRFKFLHFDSPRILSKLKDGEFDNKIVIIDEVHNIGNIMNSKSPSASIYYKLFMEAKNPKYIFLSGTPIINQIFEISKIYNILRGYMNVLEIKFKTLYDGGMNIDYKNIKYMIQKNEYVDQVVIDKTRKMITISKNPNNFITQPNGNGIIYKPESDIDMHTFKDDISKIIQKMGYKISIEERKETCFPEDKDVFERKFYNQEINKLKNIDLIKRRISGLTSFFDYQDPKAFPELLPINIVQVPMSLYQLSNYEKYRSEEIEDDKYNKRKDDKDDENSSSSYRIKSRLACSFVFPEEIGSPYDKKDTNDKIIQLETLGEHLEDFTLNIEEAEDMKKKEYNKQIYDAYLKILDKDKAKYLDIKNKSLAKYAPKYLSMINNIQKEDGKIFVYSYFKTLVGLNSFSYALIQTGKWAPFRIKKEKTKNGLVWTLDENEEDKHKHKFIFYTGSEDTTIREIYRNIYNSDFDKLDTTCSKLIEQLKAKNENNYYGEIVKLIMTTKTGAEGLDLKEVRYIHIMESYWQPVLITQIVGRGVRNKSHLRLAPKDRNVEVFIYMATIPSDMVKLITHPNVRSDIYKYSNPALSNKAFKVVSSDEHLYMLSERKKQIVNAFQKLMKETAFDCTLNYSKNILNPSNKGIICMDYNTKNRDEYIYTPGMEDTVETIDLSQEKIVVDYYDKRIVNGKTYYCEKVVNSFGKMYIYGDTLPNKVRLPKPVGEIKIIDGKRKLAFYKKKK
jgi:superfamily II DNA or RNA helicase